MQEEEALTHWNKTDHTNLFSLSLFLSAFSFGLGRDSVGREHGSKQGIKWREMDEVVLGAQRVIRLWLFRYPGTHCSG